MELPPEAIDQAGLPISHGGLGIFRAERLAPLAWVAAQAQAAPYLRAAGLSTTEQRLAESKRAWDAITQSCGADAAALLPMPCLDSDRDLAPFVADPTDAIRLQHKLSVMQHDRSFDALLPPLGARDVDRARLLAVSAHGAGMWLYAVPTHSQTRLDNDSFRRAVRLRLGLLPVRFMPSHCRPCGVGAGSFQADPWHALSCAHLKSTVLTHRHDMVVRLLSQWIRRLGGLTIVEPQPERGDGSRRRPDLDVTIGGRRFLVDVSIRHPTAPSRVARAATGPPLVTAERGAREKTLYHGPSVAAMHPPAEFVPFVLETYGGLAGQAAAFIKTVITATAQLAYVWAPPEIIHGLPYAIAVAVQRLNSRACAACLRSTFDAIPA